MIHFTREEAAMLDHLVELGSDAIASGTGYEPEDEATLDKLEALAESLKANGSAFVVTGAPAGVHHNDLFRQILSAELDHWVPDASQRLLYRAARALSVPFLIRLGSADCGPDREAHRLTKDVVVSSVLVHRCTNCYRLFRA